MSNYKVIEEKEVAVDANDWEKVHKIDDRVKTLGKVQPFDGARFTNWKFVANKTAPNTHQRYSRTQQEVTLDIESSGFMDRGTLISLETLAPYFKESMREPDGHYCIAKLRLSGPKKSKGGATFFWSGSAAEGPVELSLDKGESFMRRSGLGMKFRVRVDKGVRVHITIFMVLVKGVSRPRTYGSGAIPLTLFGRMNYEDHTKMLCILKPRLYQFWVKPHVTVSFQPEKSGKRSGPNSNPILRVPVNGVVPYVHSIVHLDKNPENRRFDRIIFVSVRERTIVNMAITYDKVDLSFDPAELDEQEPETLRPLVEIVM
jgi:hypothetical protein